MPEPAGIHHLTLAVNDLDASETIYWQVFGSHRLPEADHRDDEGHL